MRTQHPTEGFSCLAEKAHKVIVINQSVNYDGIVILMMGI